MLSMFTSQKCSSNAQEESILDKVTFTINGKVYNVNSKTVLVDISLNTFIRNHAKLTGTKFMCLEGGCGACVVNVTSSHPVSKAKITRAVNSCLFPLFACHGMDILTIEGIGNRKDGYHPAQLQLAHFNGTQCGYCSPGMVMNMYSLLEAKKGQVSMEEVENSFGGNICRCTGYRPILDAFKSLTVDANEQLQDACQDIEDLSKFCPKTGSQCAGKCSVLDNQTIQRPVQMIFENQCEWHKVYKLREVFAIFDQIGEKPYMLVGGNTAHGVYRRNENIQVFIDVNDVEELHSHSLGAELVVGGNVSLTEFMSILTNASTNWVFGYCKELVQHIDLIANVPVRNVGTIAGNLSIKNQHHEFPSDCYLLLEAIGAMLTIAESPVVSYRISPETFITTNMNKKVIQNVVLPALDPNTYFFKSFKIMPRAQNAHAYVNCAVLLKVLKLLWFKYLTWSARICFGGINPDFTHAVATEKVLFGRDPFTNDTLQAAMSTLADELKPDWVLPDASVEYRKNLAMSLFYKCMLSLAPVTIKPEYRSGATVLTRPLSSGRQTFDTIKENWPLTKNIVKLEAVPQTAGEAHYVNDFPAQPGELFAAFVLATQINGQIEKLDATDALKMSGVVAFYSAKDIPGSNNFMPEGWQGNVDPEEIFCRGKVLFHSQPVGVIVAETFAQAQKAAKAVVITYGTTEHKPIYLTLKSALDAEDTDLTVEIPQQSRTLKGRFQLFGQYHFTMEPQTCVCVPIEDGMDVYSSSQWMDMTQVAIAESLKVPMNSLNMYVRRVGGAYGAKISRSAQVACTCALATYLTRRTIRMILPIETTMSAIGKRYGCISDYTVEYDDNGRIVKLSNSFSQDYGVSFNEPVQDAAILFFSNCYDSTSWQVAGKKIRTDAPANTFCRAPGSTEGIAMIENIMEHIAHATGQDPLHVRMVNMRSDEKILQLMPQFRKDVEYDERKKAIDEFNSANRWKKRGIAIVPMHYRMLYFGQFNAIVTIFTGDGTVAITHGGIEMGQGINTKVAQVAAFMLRIPLEKVSVKPSTSVTSPNSFVSGGSMASEVVCASVKKACETLLERLKPVTDANPGASWEKILLQAYVNDIDLCAEAHCQAEELETYSVYGLSCAELEVDVLTGNVQITRVDILEDTGESMSPGIDIGQIEGSFVMGIGYYLMEELVYDSQSGALLTNRTWNYKTPGAKDIPIDFRVKFLHGSTNNAKILRAKAIGEPAVTMSIVSLFALRHALRSARKDAGLPDDWIPLGSATTPEQIFLRAGNKSDQYLLN